MPARPDTLEEAHQRTDAIMRKHGHHLGEFAVGNVPEDIAPSGNPELPITLEKMFGGKKAASLKRGAELHDAIERKKFPSSFD